MQDSRGRPCAGSAGVASALLQSSDSLALMLFSGKAAKEPARRRRSRPQHIGFGNGKCFALRAADAAIGGGWDASSFTKPWQSAVTSLGRGFPADCPLPTADYLLTDIDCGKVPIHNTSHRESFIKPY
jgi:hypothetical protein